MSRKSSNMQRVIQEAQSVALKTCTRACQLFCCPIDNLLCDNVTCSHQTTDKTTQVAIQNPPSTILILNISNSTLIDCVIGNDSYPSAVAKSQPLMRESALQMQGRCSCSCGQQGAANTQPTSTTAAPPPPLCPLLPSAECPSINIYNSHLNCVIIGDNNCMHAEQTHSTETEVLQE